MQPYGILYVQRAVIFDGIVSWCRWSDSKRNLRFSQNPVLDYYHSTIRSVQPHNCRTPIESGILSVHQALGSTHAPPTKSSRQPLPIYWSFHWHDEEILTVDLQTTFDRWVFSFFFVSLCLSLTQARCEGQNPGFARPQGSYVASKLCVLSR